MTGLHRKLLHAVIACGFSTRDEEQFGPYFVDIYVPEIHTAFEADGPKHSARKDALRDAWLKEEHGLRVIRFNTRQIHMGFDRLVEAVKYAVEEPDES